MSIFNNESILAWLKYFSDHSEIDLSTVRILDITGENRNLLPTVQANRSVLVFTDGNHPEIFYSMWDEGMGDCEIWYNEGSEPQGPMKHNLLSEMIDRGVNVSAAMLINNPRAHSGYRIGLDNDSFSPGTIRYVAHVVAVEYKPGARQTMEENVVRFGLNNVLIVDDMESYSHRWPVPDVAFLVASPKLELELQTLVRVNPKIRVVIYTLEFSFMSRIPGMLWENGIQPTEVMQLEVSKVGRKDEIEVQPAPWIFSGQAGQE